jgi:hypothetical protein
LRRGITTPPRSTVVISRLRAYPCRMTPLMTCLTTARPFRQTSPDQARDGVRGQRHSSFAGSNALGDGAPQERSISPNDERPLAAARRTRGVYAERVSFDQEHGTLGENADFVAHRAPVSGGILQIDPMCAAVAM